MENTETHKHLLDLGFRRENWRKCSMSYSSMTRKQEAKTWPERLWIAGMKTAEVLTLQTDTLLAVMEAQQALWLTTPVSFARRELFVLEAMKRGSKNPAPVGFCPRPLSFLTNPSGSPWTRTVGLASTPAADGRFTERQYGFNNTCVPFKLEFRGNPCCRFKKKKKSPHLYYRQKWLDCFRSMAL